MLRIPIPAIVPATHCERANNERSLTVALAVLRSRSRGSRAVTSADRAHPRRRCPDEPRAVVDTAVAGTHHNLIFAAHKLVTIAAADHVVDHRYRARVNGATRHALRGTLTGETDRQWAREHHPHWEP